MFISKNMNMRKTHIGIAVIFSAVFAFGLVADVSAAAIGNTVWNDRNANGVHDPGEEGIADVRIKLYNGNDVEYDETNSRGRYKFKDLDAGHYTVVVAQETLPAGCYPTYDRDGNKNGRYSDKYLKKDDYFTHADFGYHCPTTSSASVGRTSPVTGPSVMVAIIALAIGAGIGLFVYRHRTIQDIDKK
jgi:hypothetical protein